MSAGVPSPKTRDIQRAMITVVESWSQRARECGVSSGGPEVSGGPGAISPKMSPQELAAELSEREIMMRTGGDGSLDTDQWRP